MKQIDWRTILFGTIALIVLEMFGQLAFILAVAYWGSIGSDIEFIRDYKTQIWLVLGWITQGAVMFYGGWLTAQTCEYRQTLHAALAGSLATMLSTYWTFTVAVGQPTFAIVWFIILSITCATLGGLVKHLKLAIQHSPYLKTSE